LLGLSKFSKTLDPTSTSAQCGATLERSEIPLQ